MQRYFSKLSLVVAVLLISGLSQAQNDSTKFQILDEVIAVVGGEIVIASELKEQMIQYSEQLGQSADKCEVYEQLLTQKLFLHNAKIDSVEVNDLQVEGEMDRRMRYFISQIGSQEALEKYYGKSIVQLKAEFRELIREQLLIQGLQQEITGEIKITPAEVEEFFNEIPEDSLPLVNSQIEMAQIVVFPKLSSEEKQKARQKLEKIREDIIGGSDFATQAVLYSADPGSAAKGGDLGMVEKGTFVPEFDAVALSLQDGEVSKVFESQFGYHLMQMLERRGEKYRARHILIKPTVSSSARQEAQNLIDSLYKVSQQPGVDFSELAAEFSDDENSKNSGGVIVNPAKGTPRFDMSEINSQLFFVIDNLEEGEISEPASYSSPDGKEGLRIVKLITRTKAHKANLNDDYQVLKEAASAELKADALESYIKRKLKSTYVRLNEEYRSCSFNYTWFKEN